MLRAGVSSEDDLPWQGLSSNDVEALLKNLVKALTFPTEYNSAYEP
jgi:hypothetical protein